MRALGRVHALQPGPRVRARAPGWPRPTPLPRRCALAPPAAVERHRVRPAGPEPDSDPGSASAAASRGPHPGQSAEPQAEVWGFPESSGGSVRAAFFHRGRAGGKAQEDPESPRVTAFRPGLREGLRRRARQSRPRLRDPGRKGTLLSSLAPDPAVWSVPGPPSPHGPDTSPSPQISAGTRLRAPLPAPTRRDPRPSRSPPPPRSSAPPRPAPCASGPRGGSAAPARRASERASARLGARRALPAAGAPIPPCPPRAMLRAAAAARIQAWR